MSQTRAMSAVESLVNVAIGYLVAVATQLMVFPMFGIQASAKEHLAIGSIFTAVSLARSYCLRRIFNQITGRH